LFQRTNEQRTLFIKTIRTRGSYLLKT